VVNQHTYAPAHENVEFIVRFVSLAYNYFAFLELLISHVLTDLINLIYKTVPRAKHFHYLCSKIKKTVM